MALQPVDIEQSREAAWLADALPNECFTNALTVLPYFPQSNYVEGVVVLVSMTANAPVEITEHGWLEHVDGSVIDPTLGFLVSLMAGTSDAEPVPVYFPAARWTADEAKDFTHCQVCRPGSEPIPDELEAAYAAAHEWVNSNVVGREVVLVPVDEPDETCPDCGHTPDWCWCG